MQTCKMQLQVVLPYDHLQEVCAFFTADQTPNNLLHRNIQVKTFRQ